MTPLNADLICEGVCNPGRRETDVLIERYRQQHPPSDGLLPLPSDMAAMLRMMRYTSHHPKGAGTNEWACLTCGHVRRFGSKVF